MNLPTGTPGRVAAVGLLFAVCAVIWLAVITPLLGWYDSRAAALTAQSALQRRMDVLAAQLPALEQAARAQGPSAQSNAFLTDGTDAIAGADLEERLQSMASAGGASVSSAEAMDPEAEGPYRRIELHVAVTATWPALVGLLQTITTGAPAMLVDDLDVNGPQLSGETGEPPLDASFTVIAFRAAATPAPTGLP